MIKLLSLSELDRQSRCLEAISWSQNFNAQKTLAAYIEIYKKIAHESCCLTN